MNSKSTASIVKIALPVTIQALTGYALLFTDQIFVGQFDFRGLSAVANTLTPYFTLLSFFYALSGGVTILIAQALGANRPKRAQAIAESAMGFQFLLGLLYLGFWLVLARPFLTLVGAHGEILDMGVSFVSILAFQNLWMGPVLTAAGIFQGQGKTLPLMIAAIIKNILNIFFCWVFIFGNLGFPTLGVSGSALATVLADGLGSLVLLIALSKQKVIPLNLKGMIKLRLPVYFQVLKVGIPAGFEYFLWQGGQMVLVMLINRVDQTLSGFYSVMNTMLLFSVNLYIGLGTAALTLVGQAVGGKNRSLALAVGVKTTVFSLVICVFTALALVFFPKEILLLFSPKGEALGTLLPFMTILIAITFPKAVNVVIGSAIRGTGNTRWMLWTQTFGTAFIIFIAAWMLFGLGWGMAALVWAVLWDELIRGIINFGKFIHTERRQP